ncbi:MAG TPA: hypothetical protein VL334_16480 [Anaerolineae bacterium]|nr:hypothetical protein [Anaerolineae bacterium]
MHTFGVRPASKPEIKDITAWFIQERSKDARFVHLSRSAWQRFLMRNWVLPRYLRSQAHTFVLEQDAHTAGFAVVEQMGDSFTLTEFSVDGGFDEAGLLLALTRTTEVMARDREYRFARIAPLNSSEPRLALFHSAGYELIDYYLWCFKGELAGSELLGEATLRALNPKEGLEQRIDFLRQELEASEVATRAMIESSLFPRRPATFPSYSIEKASDGADESQPIGYLSLRPNERQDGVLSVAISLQPAYWGTQLEAQVVAGAIYEQAEGEVVPVRVMISTTAHADRSEASFASLEMVRGMDERPILYKDLQPEQAGK